MFGIVIGVIAICVLIWLFPIVKKSVSGISKRIKETKDKKEAKRVEEEKISLEEKQKHEKLEQEEKEKSLYDESKLSYVPIIENVVENKKTTNLTNEEEKPRPNLFDYNEDNDDFEDEVFSAPDISDINEELMEPYDGDCQTPIPYDEKEDDITEFGFESEEEEDSSTEIARTIQTLPATVKGIMLSNVLNKRKGV